MKHLPPSRSPLTRTRRRPVLRLERLEDRTVPAVFIVTNPFDDPLPGLTDLRQAVQAANLTSDPDTIRFDPSLAGQTISLTHVDSIVTTTQLAPQTPAVAFGPSGLVVSSPITIDGNGVGTLTRAAGAPNFRLFTVIDGASLTMSDMELTGGLASGVGATGDGGAVFNLGTLDLTDCTLANNRAEGTGTGGRGGAIYAQEGSAATTLADCTVADNVAANFGGGASGGGLFNLDGSMTLTYCTVAGNVVSGAAAAGGAVYNLEQVTPRTGAPSANLLLRYSILAGSVGGVDVVNERANPALGTATFNAFPLDIVQTAPVAIGAVTRNDAGVLVADPMLGPLTDNGGPTLTMALRPGSIALNAAVVLDSPPAAPATDQRGVVRDGQPDIGAFEVASALTPTFTSSARLFSPHDNDNTSSAFIRGLYQSVLGRPAAPDEVQAWLNLIIAGVQRPTIAQMIYSSPEHRALQVAQYYRSLLNREASPAEVMFWVDQFVNHGLDEATAVLQIVQSGEFQSLYATDTAYVNALYFYFLGRTPGAAELTAGTAMVASAGRGATAHAILFSTESVDRVIGSYYAYYLQRPAVTNELLNWEVLLSGGLTFDQAAAAFAGSPEFFNNAIAATP
jgi:hypothetical protein